MAVTDPEFNALKRRVSDLEDIHAGQRLKDIRADLDIARADVSVMKADLDNAHTAFLAMRAQVDDLQLQLGAACDRIAVLETASDPTWAAA